MIDPTRDLRQVFPAEMPEQLDTLEELRRRGGEQRDEDLGLGTLVAFVLAAVVFGGLVMAPSAVWGLVDYLILAVAI